MFSINDAVLATKGKFHGTPGMLLTDICGVAIDNRKTGPGFLFVPIKGDRFDGHDFIPAAFEAGAAITLTEKNLEPGHPYIKVKDTLKAFQMLAEYYKSTLNVKTIGITGSVGKTTTKEMITSVLSQEFRTACTSGNLNNQTGVPLTVFGITKDHEAAVIEMGTNHFGEIKKTARIVRPDYCVLTNIGEAHIEFLKSQSGILKAKTEMLKYKTPGGRVIVNGDDIYLASLKKRVKNLIKYGLADSNDLIARNIHTKGLHGTDFTCCIHNYKYDISVPAPGLHMVYNSMAALAVGRCLGMSIDNIVKGIADYSPISGRMNIIEADGITILDDAYNANPDSMRASLNVLAYAEGRKICIIGDMFELGSESAAKHEEIINYADDRRADVIICIGEQMAEALNRKSRLKAEAHSFLSAEQAEKEIRKIIHKGDTVLVKASRGMHLESIVNLLGK